MGKKTLIALGFGLVINMMVVGGDITCKEAVTYLLPCEPFLLDLGPRTPSLNCCTNVGTIFKETTTVELRRSICRCLKKAANEAGIKHERASQLPQLCKTRFSFLIDPFVDCNSIP